MNDPKAARGVTVSARGLEASLALPNAEAASLCVYDDDHEIHRAPMMRDEGGVLRGLAPGYGAGSTGFVSNGARRKPAMSPSSRMLSAHASRPATRMPGGEL